MARGLGVCSQIGFASPKSNLSQGIDLSSRMDVTQQQAQDIVAQTEGDDAVIEQFQEICNKRFRYDVSITRLKELSLHAMLQLHFVYQVLQDRYRAPQCIIPSCYCSQDTRL